MTPSVAAEQRAELEPFVNEWGVKVRPVVVLNGKPVYALQPKQLECYDLTPLSPRWQGHRRIGYGGAAGGGKSHLSRALLTAAAFAWPGSTSLIFRETLGEVVENHVEKFLTELPEGIYRYKGGNKPEIRWANGSRTLFGFLRYPKDVFKYQGAEYDVVVFEEATHYLKAEVSWLLNNRLRATVNGSIPFAVFPSNPGNKGHIWFKRWFVEKRYEPQENPDEYAFVQAFLSDNEVLRRRDPQYEKNLDQLDEPWRSWLRDGDFEKGAGTYFHELRREVHYLPAEGFHVPDHWPLFGGFDPGYNHPWVFGIYAADEDGTTYKLETCRGRHMTDLEIIAAIHDQVKASPVEIDMGRLSYAAAGLDAFSKRGRELGYDGPTQAERFQEHGITLIEANVGRIHGAKNLREYLHWEPPGGRGPEPNPDLKHGMDPALYLVETPGNEHTFSTLESMVMDPDNMEDVLKVDADDFGRGGDDEYDETRYAIASRPKRAKSVGLERQPRAWDPEVLQHEAETKRRVKDQPLPPRRGKGEIIGRWW